MSHLVPMKRVRQPKASFLWSHQEKSVGFLVQKSAIFSKPFMLFYFVFCLCPLLNHWAHFCFVCLFVGVCFYSANFDRTQMLRTVRTCEDLICLASPLIPDVCLSAWHIQSFQQVQFQWRNGAALTITVISGLPHFMYCLFPPFGKTSELLKAFFLCNQELFWWIHVRKFSY